MEQPGVILKMKTVSTLALPYYRKLPFLEDWRLFLMAHSHAIPPMILIFQIRSL